MVAIKDNPIDLKDYEMKNVEQFSLRNRKPFTEIGGTLQASNHLHLMPEMQRSTVVNKINFGGENDLSSGYQNKPRSNFKSISNVIPKYTFKANWVQIKSIGLTFFIHGMGSKCGDQIWNNQDLEFKTRRIF